MSVAQVLDSQVATLTTNTVAAAAVTSPLWLQNLSNGAAVLLPILGCLWLLIQIFYHFRKVSK